MSVPNVSKKGRSKSQHFHVKVLLAQSNNLSLSFIGDSIDVGYTTSSGIDSREEMFEIQEDSVTRILRSKTQQRAFSVDPFHCAVSVLLCITRYETGFNLVTVCIEKL